MNRLLLFFAIVGFAACTGTEQAEQKTDNRHTYQLPELFAANSDTNLISDHVYIIGWSDDGKIAYINEPGDEACGCYFMDLCIKDGVQNKELYRYHFTNENREAEKRTKDNLASVWKQNEKTFSDTLNHYGIVPGNFTATKGDSHVSDSVTLHASVSMTLKSNTDYGVPTITDYRVLLQGRASAIPVYTSTDEERNAPLLHIVPEAVISGPSGRYAAVLIAREYRGWEGPPNTWRYDVYTCRFK